MQIHAQDDIPIDVRFDEGPRRAAAPIPMRGVVGRDPGEDLVEHAALNGPEDCIHEMRAIYRKRREALVDSFGRAGWTVPPPAASMFAWAPLPEPFREMGSLEFSKLLVEKAEIAVSPGVAFGEHGEGFVRIALVENEQRIRQAARNLRRFLDTGLEKLHNVVPLATRR